jgi:hypothetical protein
MAKTKVTAKTILKDKFWIIEDHGQKIGTVSVCDDQYLFASDKGTEFFSDLKKLKKKFGVEIIFSGADSSVEENTNERVVYGYPSNCTPYNAMFDIKRKLPLFTKSNKSKSVYCAGYYIVHFEKGWVKSFCPKLITVERYETKGPFKTEIEMRQELSRANSN